MEGQTAPQLQQVPLAEGANLCPNSLPLLKWDAYFEQAAEGIGALCRCRRRTVCAPLQNLLVWDALQRSFGN